MIDPRGVMWPADESEWLVNNYRDKSAKVCAAHLARSPSAVRQKAKRLGVTRREKKVALKPVRVFSRETVPDVAGATTSNACSGPGVVAPQSSPLVAR